MNDFIIAVDWGTSYLRAYLCQIQTDGSFSHKDTVIGLGVNKVDGNFEQELFNQIKPWTEQHGKLPIYLAGQIGSSIGWKETQYIPCPTSPFELANACLNFYCQNHQLSIIPGLSCNHDNSYQDVMRGEELQVLGWLSQNPSHKKGQHLICLPGTHTKWVLVDNGQIKLFKTAMTGELYDLLCNHSVLIQSSEEEFCFDIFEQGAQYTLNSELGSFTHGLFSVRSKQLFNDIAPKHARAYLSGMLIGTDVRAAVNATEWQLASVDQIAIIGNRHLSKQFKYVFAQLGVTGKIFDVEQISIAGFENIYRARLTNQ